MSTPILVDLAGLGTQSTHLLVAALVGIVLLHIIDAYWDE